MKRTIVFLLLVWMLALSACTNTGGSAGSDAAAPGHSQNAAESGPAFPEEPADGPSGGSAEIASGETTGGVSDEADVGTSEGPAAEASDEESEGPSGETFTDHVIEWTDPALEAAFREMYGKEEGEDIWLSEIAYEEILNLPDKGITDISDLSEMKYLKRIILTDNDVEDISPLSGMFQLEQLDINNNPITDISVLAGLKQLQLINLTGTNITDLSPLYGLTDLISASLFDIDADESEIAALQAALPNTEIYSGSLQEYLDQYQN